MWGGVLKETARRWGKDRTTKEEEKQKTLYQVIISQFTNVAIVGKNFARIVEVANVHPAVLQNDLKLARYMLNG